MKTRKPMKILLSIVLTLTMALALLPGTVFAALPAGTPGESEANPVTTFAELQGACAVAVGTGDNVWIGADITITSNITTLGNVINRIGYTLTVSSGVTVDTDTLGRGRLGNSGTIENNCQVPDCAHVPDCAQGENATLYGLSL